MRNRCGKSRLWPCWLSSPDHLTQSATGAQTTPRVLAAHSPGQPGCGHYGSGSTFAACLGFALAFLVAHTRVQSRIHSLREVIVGGLLGFLITMILFQLSA